jgi:outer membrane protein assembly factor BamE (lipoprotein component of BamABCDE complex)
MKAILVLALALALSACASFDGRGLTAGVSTAADVERAMGQPAEKRQVGNETWYYYPRQPYGRRTFVARLGTDGRLIGVEQRLTHETIAKIIPNTTRREQVRDLLGPPWLTTHYARLDRDVWTWYMERYNGSVPVLLSVQMSPDGIVREVYMIDEFQPNHEQHAGIGFRGR